MMNYLLGLQDEEEIYQYAAQSIAEAIDNEIMEFFLHEAARKSEAEMRQRFPHTCPFCGSAAYIGLATLDCYSKCNVPKRWIIHMEIMGDE